METNEEAGAGGGGAAVATPTAAVAPAAAPANIAGADFSFFRNIPGRDVSEVAKVAPAAAAVIEKPFVVNDDAGKPIEGASFATQAEAEAYVAAQGKGAVAAGAEKTPAELAAEELAAQTNVAGAATGAEVAPDAVLKTPIFGRFKTIKETEEYIKQSGDHAQKLDAENKKLKADAESALATRETELAAAKAELEMVRNTPPFQELTKEEYDALAKEDPGAAVDYRLAKRDHDDAVKRTKDDAARSTYERQEQLKASKSEVVRVVKEMEADDKAYPMFRDVDPLMGQIFEAMGGKESALHNDPRAVNVLYRAAMGTLYIGLLQKGKVAKADATDVAKKTAAAAAAATAGAGAGAGGVPAKAKTKAEVDQENWSKNIKEAGHKKVLSFAD